MNNIICDVCKKTVKEPKRGRNYFTLRHLHLCRGCKAAVEREMMDRNEPDEGSYNFLAKKDLFWNFVERKCAKEAR